MRERRKFSNFPKILSKFGLGPSEGEDQNKRGSENRWLSNRRFSDPSDTLSMIIGARQSERSEDSPNSERRNKFWPVFKRAKICSGASHQSAGARHSARPSERSEDNSNSEQRRIFHRFETAENSPERGSGCLVKGNHNHARRSDRTDEVGPVPSDRVPGREEIATRSVQWWRKLHFSPAPLPGPFRGPARRRADVLAREGLCGREFKTT